MESLAWYTWSMVRGLSRTSLPIICRFVVIAVTSWARSTPSSLATVVMLSRDSYEGPALSSVIMPNSTLPMVKTATVQSKI